MWYVLCVIVGSLIGFLIAALLREPTDIPKNIGTLNVMESDDGPYLFVELNEPAYRLYNDQIISMDVKAIHTNSQK